MGQLADPRWSENSYQTGVFVCTVQKKQLNLFDVLNCGRQMLGVFLTLGEFRVYQSA